MVGLAQDAPLLMDVGNLAQRDCGCFSRKDEQPTEPASVERSNAYWRAAYVDALLADDSLIVLRSSRVVVLEGVGPTLWLAADGVTEDELRDAALRELPEPPAGIDVATVISETVRDLVKAGLLVRT